MPKKTEMESLTSEYSMSAADNGLSRKHLNKSILSPNASEVPNEGQYRKKMKEPKKQ